jgi:hypothetical protein
VATLVERKTRFVVLAKMDGCGADAALEALTTKFRRVPLALRKSLTYDQGKEMAHHAELTRRVSIEVFFADPHSPWQRPSNENMNGLIREYLPERRRPIDLLTRILEQGRESAELSPSGSSGLRHSGRSHGGRDQQITNWCCISDLKPP